MSRLKYKRIKLPDGTTRDEHRLIMEAFLGRKLERREVVHHINGNTLDNRLDNLELKSLSAHSRLHQPKGRKLSVKTCKKISEHYNQFGENSYRTHFTNKDVLNIISRLNCGERCSDLAREYNVHRSAISKIKRGINWKKALATIV